MLNFFPGFWHWGRTRFSLDSGFVFWEVMGCMAGNGQLLVMGWENREVRQEEGKQMTVQAQVWYPEVYTQSPESTSHREQYGREGQLSTKHRHSCFKVEAAPCPIPQGMNFPATLPQVWLMRAEVMCVPSELIWLRRHQRLYQLISLVFKLNEILIPLPFSHHPSAFSYLCLYNTCSFIVIILLQLPSTLLAPFSPSDLFTSKTSVLVEPNYSTSLG